MSFIPGFLYLGVLWRPDNESVPCGYKKPSRPGWTVSVLFVNPPYNIDHPAPASILFCWLSGIIFIYNSM